MFNAFWHDVWIALFVLLIVVGVFGGQGLIVGLGVMGLAVAGISWLWNKLSLEEVSYKREVSESRLFIGEETTLSVTVTNRKPVPLSRLQIEDEIPDPIKFTDADVGTNSRQNSSILRHTTSLAWYERMKWEYRIKSDQRGLYRLGPAWLESGDIFGFFSSRKPVPDDAYILVYPKVVPLPELGMPAMRPLGETRGGIDIFQDLSRPQGIRDYQVGDPMKTIDWKVSAKMQQLQVRTFEPSSAFTVILVVVVETTEQSWEGYVPSNLESVIVAAASVAAYAAEREYNLGLFSNGTPILADRPMKIPPTRSPEQLTIILEALATIRPMAVGPMAPQLAQHARQFPVGTTLVIVAALISDDMVEAIVNLQRQGYKLVMVHVGNRECPELPDGVLVHRLSDYLEGLEVASEFGPG